MSDVLYYVRHLMICISGWAGTGKDECAGRLVKYHGAIHTGLADPGKRHLMDAYGFSEEQLWGPSEFRNAGDVRYPKPNNHGGNELQEKDPDFWLSPREALQKYMELMNTLYADTWIQKGINDHRLLATDQYVYSKKSGLVASNSHLKNKSSVFITCFSDFRHIHECRLVKESANNEYVPILVRIKRPTVTRPPFNHRSETEQTRIRDTAFDFIINNNSTLEKLYAEIDAIVDVCSKPGWSGKSWDSSFVFPELQESYCP